MLILRIVTKRHLTCVKNACHQVRHLATRAKPKSELMRDFKVSLPSTKQKLPKRPPFAKNLFLGNFDFEFLTYPEPQSPDRYNEFQLWLEPIKDFMKSVDAKEIEETDSIPPYILQKFRELGVFGARIPTDYQGMNLLHSEYMQVLETVGRVPSLGLFLLKQGVPPINLLLKYGTVEQKFKYFPKMATGQFIGTVALTEDTSGPTVDRLQTIAMKSEDDKYWIITGEKKFVSNANLSNVFVVYAHALEHGGMQARPETISSFIVEAQTEGVTVQRNCNKTLGLKGFEAGTLILRDVKIPAENLLGEIGDAQQQLPYLFSSGRHFIASLTIAILKNFLELLTTDILLRKHFEQMLHETESAQNIIAETILSIYAMESILYLTTGVMDIYDDQDVMLETALVEQFCVQECLTRLQNSMWLIGPRVCTLVQPFEKILRDAFTVTNYETALIDTKIYSSLLGMQHFGIATVAEIKKLRNPLMNPLHVLKNAFKRKKSLNLHLEEYVHPSLRECTDFCDMALFKLKESTEMLLLHEGTDVTTRHMDLQRLSDIITQIYVYIGIVSRASRSYCIGNRDADEEIKMCMTLAYRLEQKVTTLAADIEVSEYGNGDFICKELANLLFERKKYYPAHPLQRNY